MWLESGVDPPSYLAEDRPPLLSLAASSDLAWENSAQNLKLEFVWAPVVNGDMNRALERWARGQAVYLDVKLFKLYRTVLLIAVGVADPHTVHSNADPDPGSALAFMRFRIQMQIRIQKVKIRLEKLKGKQKNVHGKYLNFQFKFSAFFASGFGSIKSPVILILVTDYYSAADPHHGLL